MSAARPGYGRVLASRQLQAIVGAQLVSVAGSSVAAVALTVEVYRRTASPLLASLGFTLAFTPYLLGGLVFSRWVHRARPRRLVTSCDGASALVAGAMAVPGLPVGALLGLVLALGCLASLAVGARTTLVRAGTDEATYVPARSLMRVAAQVAQLGGNAAGGALLVVLSPGGVFVVNAASYAVAALAVRVVVAEHPASAPAPAATGRRPGVRDALRPAAVRRLVLLGWVLPACTVAPEALAAPYVADHHGSSVLVGWWLTALPVGLILGDVLGVRWLAPARQRAWIAWMGAASCLPYLAFAADPPIAAGIGLLVVAGAVGPYGLGLDGELRAVVPEERFTHVMTVNAAGLMVVQGVGFVAAGALGSVLGAGPAVAVAGGVGVVSAALLRPRPRPRLR